MKILALTSIRSDYDLMSSLYKLLQQDKNIELKLLVSGAHLSRTYGYSVDLIRQDGFEILLCIESLVDSDSPQARLKTASIMLQNSIDSVADYAPDLILLAGDREDVIMGALLGGYLDIPTIHFYGGDHVQDGHIDNPVRHATSKLATAHMVTLEEHKNRLIAMGERAERIFTIGNIALDRFVQHRPLALQEIKHTLRINREFDHYALLIFHPVNEERAICHHILENILQTLKKRAINTFISMPNTDPGNKQLIDLLISYQDDDNFCCYKNLKRNHFLSLYKGCEFIIGNSSCGILESASIPVAAINVGLRQRGRSANDNVVFCGTEAKEIDAAIEQVQTPAFKKSLFSISNIYGDGHSAARAYEIIKTTNFTSLLLKKEDPLGQQNGAGK